MQTYSDPMIRNNVRYLRTNRPLHISLDLVREELCKYDGSYLVGSKRTKQINKRNISPAFIWFHENLSSM